MESRSFRRLVAALMAVGLIAAGCQGWPRKRTPDEAGVDVELTTQPAAPVSVTGMPPEPRPGFDQEPKQAP